MAERKSPPAGLQLVGKRLWRAVLDDYELRVDELILLENACRTADCLAKLDAALTGAPLTVRGSMGQEREHPLLSEARQQRALLARLLVQLKLPADDLTASWRASQRSVQARATARARWNRGA